MQHGENVFELAETNIPAGGFIQAARRDGHTLLPVIWTAASPSAHVTQEAYEKICQQIIAHARELKPDAVYLDLHGAMVAEHYDDGEGELLRRMRETLGDDTPIIVSLDLHANVTNEMLHHATAMVAFRTYPHVDMAATGQKAYQLLLIATNGPLIQENARIPFLIPINGMCTFMEPARGIYHLLEELEKQPGVSSLSFAPGFPAADFPECGPVVWGYGSNNAVVERAVRTLRDAVCHAEPAWAVEFLSPEEAVAQAQKLAQEATRPVIIADTQDNPGAGGSGDTTGILRALIAADANAALGLLLDPEAVKEAIATGKGKSVTLTLGGKSDTHGDPAVNDTFIVDEISEGKCRFDGPMMNGIVVDVGPVVTLRHRNVKVVVSSVKSQMLDRNLFRLGGINPEQESILVVKSSVHFRADFQPIASTILVAKSKGEMKADSQDLPWIRLHEGIRIAPLGKAFTQI